MPLFLSDPLDKWPYVQMALSSRDPIFKELTLQVNHRPSLQETLPCPPVRNNHFKWPSLHGTLSSNRPSSCDLLLMWSSCQAALSHCVVLEFFWSRTDLKQSIRSGLRPYATFKQHHLCLTTLQVALSSSNALFKQCFHQVSKFQKCGHPASYVCWKKQQPSSSFSQFASLCTPLVLVHK